MARWRTVPSNAAAPLACGRARNYRQAKLMQQQQNYGHSVDSGDYFLIEMMTNPLSPNRQSLEGGGWQERLRLGLKEGAEGGKSLGSWNGNDEDSSQVVATRPCSLTYTSHGWPGKSCNCATLTFHNDVLLSKTLSVWFDSIKCVLHEFRT